VHLVKEIGNHKKKNYVGCHGGRESNAGHRILRVWNAMPLMFAEQSLCGRDDGINNSNSCGN
jgi:hypothetical protein